MPYRNPDNTNPSTDNLFTLLVPYKHFGNDITAHSWNALVQEGAMKMLSVTGCMRFFWLALSGWSMLYHTGDGVVFGKEVSAIEQD